MNDDGDLSQPFGRGQERGACDVFISKASGRAFVVSKGSSLRVVQPEAGQQVVDLNAFNLSNPSEHFWSTRTAFFFGAHISTGAELLSTPPRETPMLRIRADTFTGRVPAGDPLPHDVFFGRCSQEMRRKHYGPPGDSPGCQEYLAEAISEFGLGEEAVHDPYNMFMQTWINERDQFAFIPSTARAGDYVELQALMDCLIAVSACPGYSSGAESTGILIELE